MKFLERLAPASRFTVFGAEGFIGSHLVEALRAQGADVATPDRAAAVCSADLGHVIYAIGLTADFRKRPYDTMTAHVTRLTEILQQARYESFLYLSSTRVYARAITGEESAITPVDVTAPGDLYNISKLAGEALCLTHGNPAVRVARLSNVFGKKMLESGASSSNFLASVIQQAVCNGHVTLETSPESCKDFIHIDDVVRALILIAQRGAERLYNVASGENVTHAAIMERIAQSTGCSCTFDGNAPYASFPPISTALIAHAFDQAGDKWAPLRIIDALSGLIPHTRSTVIPAQGAAA